MGLLEILGLIWEFIISLIGGLFVTYDVTFLKPTVLTDNEAKLTGIGNSYTVNKNNTKISTAFIVNGYKSFVWYTNNASTGNFKAQSKCITVSKGVKNTGYNLTVSSSDKVARQGKVRVYKSEDCSGEYKEYFTAKISYEAGTTKGLCTFTHDGDEYSGVCDKSNGAYKNIGTQGPKTCNCYTKAYGLAMVLNKFFDVPNTNNMSDNEAHKKALECWEPKWAGDYYLDEDIVLFDTPQDAFNGIRKEIKDTGRPVMVLVSTKNGPTANSSGTHFYLVSAIKTDSLDKAKSDLNYSDFYILDPLYDRVARTDVPPIEKNWAKRNNEKGKKYGQLLKSPSSDQYYIVKFN